MRSESIDWAAHIEAVARRLYGEPNQKLSSRDELRFGTNGSLRVSIGGPNKGTWRDHENKMRGGVLALIQHKLGLSKGDAIDWFKSEMHVDMVDKKPAPEARPAPPQRVVATYRYTDEQGTVLYRVLRWGPQKTFVQNPPDGKGGWITGKGCMDGVRRVPYWLNEWLWHSDRTLFIAEGEKDVDRLRSLGLLATCNVAGAGNWLPVDKENAAEFVAHFRGRTVIVLPHNDDAGRSHADDIVRSLLPVAAEIKVVELPELPPKGDVSDWLDAGGDKDALLALIEAAVPMREMPATGPARNVVPLRPKPAGPQDDDQEPPEGALDLFGHPLNDIGNAKRLIAQHGAALRYVVSIGWHIWDGKRYAHDPATVAARRLSHATAREMLTYAFDLPSRTKEQEERKKGLMKFAIGSGNTAKINGMLAQAEPYLAVTTDDLDRDPWLLNCSNGTLDLRTKQLRPHSQDDLITKVSPVAYDPNAACPTWERIIMEIFNGDNDMVDYVQRSLGYCLTGLTREQVVFILHGAGSNGKSLMLEIVAEILGDYAAQCPSDTFVESHKGGAIPNDIARLVGARFVSVVETEQDRKLAEGLVKQATGGDRMTARFLRQEFFEFIPKFKLAMATNHKPRVRGTDNAIWRRIRLWPYLVVFADAEGAKDGQPVKDLSLKETLMKELEGIFRWLVDGCKNWQEHGLTKAPDAVMEATTEYRESQDATAGFVAECCHVSPGLHVKVGPLYKVYRNWCERSGETAMSSVAFGLALEEKGFASKKGTGGVRERSGLNLRLELDPDAKTEESA